VTTGSHAEATLPESTLPDPSQRRRSSVWSMASSASSGGTSRRSKIFGSVKNLFGGKKGDGTAAAEGKEEDE